MYQTARGFGQEMGRTFGGMGQAFRGGDFGGGFQRMGQAFDQAGGFGRGMQSGYQMASMMRRPRRFGGGY